MKKHKNHGHKVDMIDVEYFRCPGVKLHTIYFKQFVNGKLTEISAVTLLNVCHYIVYEHREVIHV